MSDDYNATPPLTASGNAQFCIDRDARMDLAETAAWVRGAAAACEHAGMYNVLSKAARAIEEADAMLKAREKNQQALP